MTEQIGRSRTKLRVDAYTAGKRAWQEQVAPGNNPYRAGSEEAKKWTAGYKAAEADSLHEGA